MLLINNLSLDPYFNIAAEEYLLHHFDEEIVMVWRSIPSVIVGKHQNTLAEINLHYVLNNNIPVVRRLSGGGTVFHDLGNINFTFIRKIEGEKMVDFKAQTAPIISFLHSLGVHASFEGKNDLRVNGLKISGNAEHIYKNKVLHHGTLLFDADLSQLQAAINARSEKFVSKAIKSVRSKVGNISDFLPLGFTREMFMQQLVLFLCSNYDDYSQYLFQRDDILHIEQLMIEKYKTWEWNYGYSPVYKFVNEGIVNTTEVRIELDVKKGMCIGMELYVNQVLEYDTPSIVNIPHHPDAIDQFLKKNNFLQYNTLSEKWDMLGLFF